MKAYALARKPARVFRSPPLARGNLMDSLKTSARVRQIVGGPRIQAKLAKRSTVAAEPLIQRATQEEAQMAAEARKQAATRFLSPEEIKEVSLLKSLADVQAKDAGPGVRELATAIAVLAKYLPGKLDEYKLSVSGSDLVFTGGGARVTVTSLGILRVDAAKKHKPTEAPSGWTKQGQFDLRGISISGTLKDPASEFVEQELGKIEKAEQKRVLAELTASETKVATTVDKANPLTLSALVKDATSGLYLQNSKSELVGEVAAGFTDIRARFDAVSKTPIDPGSDRQHRIEAFADSIIGRGVIPAIEAKEKELVTLTGERDAADQRIASLGENLKAANAANDKAKAVGKELGAEKSKKVKLVKKISAVEATKKPLIAQRDKFRSDLGYILDSSRSPEDLAKATVGGLCNVLSYYLYGKAIGVLAEATPFSQYYAEQVLAGNVTRQSKDSTGVNWGAGSAKWRAQRGMTELGGGAVAVGDPSRRSELDTFLASGANVALSHQDLDGNPPSKPHHFLLIVKGDDGTWRNLDHTSSKYRHRGGPTDWQRVFKLTVDKGLIDQATPNVKSSTSED